MNDFSTSFTKHKSNNSSPDKNSNQLGESELISLGGWIGGSTDQGEETAGGAQHMYDACLGLS